VDLIAGVVTGAVAIHAAAGAFFLAVRLRRPGEPEYGVASALCVSLACLAAARTAELHASSGGELLALSRLASVALIGVFVLHAHLGIEYAQVSARRGWLFLAYGLGAVFELLNARGLLNDVRSLTAGPPPQPAPLTFLGVSLLALGLGSAGAALVLFARAYLAGRREAIALVIGETIVVAALLNDVGYVAVGFATTFLGAVGFVALVAGLTSTVLSRYSRVLAESTKRGQEIRARSRELRKVVADLEAAREELGRKEQLAVVGELAAVIAHEVRNPLAIIANAVAGLRKPTLGKDDQETLLSILDEENSRLNRLVSDLLRYARPVNVQRQNISLRDLLERGLQLVNNRKSLTVELKVEATELRLWGDGNLLRQVFENLIDNACQAMHYGGTLTVRVRPMSHEGQDGLAVDIIDTGEGMDTIVRSRARDPFFTTRPSGTGLGLAIVDRIVDAHGGHFVIESRAGEGTTATVFLPCGSPSEPPPPRSRNPTRRTSSPEVKAVKVG
jgi:signal transduction histidine kinase